MNLGIVGTGFIVREVLPLLRSWGINPAAVCGTPQSIAEVEELCKANNVAKGYGEYAELLADKDVDTVYIAVPNFLHFSFTRKALEAGKNVIVEKPMTSNYKEAALLADLAKNNGLYLFEAISTVYLPNFLAIQEGLKKIGQVKMVVCNFSQYSRRYDAFRAGQVLPAFDPAKSGGALMDLNLYNIHYLLGLFGEPKSATYLPNMERGIDTSGVLLMDYDGFKAVSIASKDCGAPFSYSIQGTDGYIRQNTSANFCGEVTIHLNDGTETVIDQSPDKRLEPEFRRFAKAVDSGDTEFCYKMLEHSLAVSKLQTEVRLAAGIRFPADE